MLDVLPLGYLGLPALLYLGGWITPPLGFVAAAALALCLVMLLRGGTQPGSRSRLAPAAIAITIVIAAVWTLSGGLGHFVYANRDWVVRDAVLLDLVRNSWPVIYDSTPTQPALMLRAPIAFYLPAAVVGKLLGLRAAEWTLLLWTGLGVLLTFLLMQRDRPRWPQLSIRLAVFIAFSGMDIVGMITHYNPHPMGEHLEWWAFIFQYSSTTTQLFWVPNHALPGWIAMAWLLGYQGQRLPIAIAIAMVALTPLWSPLCAIGLAPLFGVAIFVEWMRDRSPRALSAIFDLRVIAVALICGALVYPYLVIGSETVGWALASEVRWVGEDFLPRYIEFVLFEFVLFAALLLWRFGLEPLLICAIVLLLLLPLYRIGGVNDLAMRGSIPALALLAIRLGGWLSSPPAKAKETTARVIAAALLVVGAVTPLMEVWRVFIAPRWDMDTSHSLPEVTRGYAPHYLTPRDQPWLNRFMGSPAPR